MTRALNPVQAEVYKQNPNWVTVAERIAEQPGCETFPVGLVHKIISRPGELIVIPIEVTEETCAIGAIIAARDRPFEPQIDGTDRITALRIAPAKKEYTKDIFMHAAREIIFSTDNARLFNWMGAGIRSPHTTLAADIVEPSLAVGTAEVNAFFEALTRNENYSQHGDRLIGALFQTARLALDFEAPSPTSPEVLSLELAQAKRYYQTALQRVHAMQDIRSSLAMLEDLQQSQSAVPRPAIHYDKPIDLPAASDVTKMRRLIAYPPSHSDIQSALASYDIAIATLDSLRAN